MGGLFDNWVLDVTNFNPDMPCYVPIEKNGDIVLGMNYLSGKCPGKLIGVVHLHGQKVADDWCDKHPDWHEKYSNN